MKLKQNKDTKSTIHIVVRVTRRDETRRVFFLKLNRLGTFFNGDLQLSSL